MSATLATQAATLDLAHFGRTASPLTILATASDRRNIFQVWRERIRFRQQLWRLLRDKPELIEDIGLTIADAREEIAQPFWRPSRCVARR
jgi:uncharacterized protein YjiS (DUF1127 family)